MISLTWGPMSYDVSALAAVLRGALDVNIMRKVDPYVQVKRCQSDIGM